MQKCVLPNGLTVIHVPKKVNSVVVQVMVRVGSNDEMERERGIAHFLEHILFEGTLKRPTNLEISSAIEKVGGNFNAYTTGERTCFYIKVTKKHFSLAVDVLADILQNPLFKEEHIKKERNIVLKEIDMVNDEPGYYQWILLQRLLYVKHPARFPTYGRREVIANLDYHKVKAYFCKYYHPNNMVVCIIGDIRNWKQVVKAKFQCTTEGEIEKKRPSEPLLNRNRMVKEKRKIINTRLVLGFHSLARTHKDSYVFEIIDAILGRGQSGRMFNEIRSKRGLAYEVGTQHVCDSTFGYFAVYASIDRKNVNLVKQVMLDEIQKLEHITDKDLQEAKDFLEGDYLLELEDSQKFADQVLFWEQVQDSKLMRKYIRNINAVTKHDVRRVVQHYCKHYGMVVLEGK